MRLKSRLSLVLIILVAIAWAPVIQIAGWVEDSRSLPKERVGALQGNLVRARAPSSAPKAVSLLRRDQTRTIVIVIDGMEPELLSPTLTPHLASLIAGELGAATTFTNAKASMVTETNTNHASIVTGLPGGSHGIVANNLFNRSAAASQSTAKASMISSPTLFDAFAVQRPELATAVVMGKERLRDLFDCTRTSEGACGPSADNPEGVAVQHVRPNFLRGGTTNPLDVLVDPDGNAPGEPFFGATIDNFVIDQVIDLHSTAAPALTFVNLPTVDGQQHLFGSKSAQGLASVTNVDAQIGRLITWLRDAGLWEQTILMITADHSFSELDSPGDALNVGPTRVSNPVLGHATGTRVVLSETLSDPGVLAFVAHAGSASIFLREPEDGQLAAELAGRAEDIKDVFGRPAVAAAYCRRKSLTCPEIPKEWGLDTARIGEVLLTADDSHVFVVRRSDVLAVLTGHHGGPTSLPVPLIIASGGPYIRTSAVSREVTTRDIAPTIASIYGLKGPDGGLFPGFGRWSRSLNEAFAHPVR